MIGYDEARALILNNMQPLASEVLPLAAARNRYMSTEFHATFPQPRFDNSAVDGFAIQCDDIARASAESPVILRIIDTIKTGSPATNKVVSGTAIRIFTGAMLPSGASGVVMVEDVVSAEGTIRISAPLKRGSNIRKAGEEFKTGDLCVNSGAKLTPPVLGLLASFGVTSVSVGRTPKVSLIVTGSELVPVGQSLLDAQIYDSNRHALIAALSELGCVSVTIFSCGDEEQELNDVFKKAMADADMIITSGGASVGDVDLIKPVINALGGRIKFEKVSIKPGKPTVFADVNGIPVIALPGNPVSALVTFFLFVRPALKRLMGAAATGEMLVTATLDRSLKKRSSRTEFVRAHLESRDGNLVAIPSVGQDSHMLSGLADADSLIVFEGPSGTLEAGAAVHVMRLTWN